MTNYDASTINSLNPMVRFAHRNRLKHSLRLAKQRIEHGKILDYGCGTGMFISKMLSIKPDSIIGYEPYLEERAQTDLPIYQSLDDIKKLGPYGTITLFETIEHLEQEELDEFLAICNQLLSKDGVILISAPIEIGPALILKEISRSIFRFKRPEHHFLEFVKASIFAIPARRAENRKTSHRGYDFRNSIAYLAGKGWDVKILSYGPLPLKTWYGNSQVYIKATKIL